MPLSTYHETDRMAQRRAERQRQMDHMEEAANVSLMDMMSGTSPIPGSPQPSVGSGSHASGSPGHRSGDLSHQSHQTGGSSSGGTEASTLDDLPLPPLSHEQIRENARRFLDDSTSFEPAAGQKMSGINSPDGNGAGQGTAASLVDRARQLLFDAPPGSVSGRARSVPSGSASGSGRSVRSVPGHSFGASLGSGVSPDKSTSPDRRRVYSTRSYGTRVGMRDSMRNLFNQVQERLHYQEEAQKGRGGGGRRGSMMGSIVGWSKRSLSGRSSEDGFSDGSGGGGGNLAPAGRSDGGGAGAGALRTVKLGGKGGRDGSGRDLAYDPDNDEETFLERARFACWEACGRAKYYCTNRSALLLSLTLVLVVGSVIGVAMTFYDAEQEVVHDMANNAGGSGGKEGAALDAPGATEDDQGDELVEVLGDLPVNELVEDLEDLPVIEDAAAGLRFGRIKERIIESGVSTEAILSYSAESDGAPSSQYRALAWISAEDPMKLDPEDDFLLQRYALATFWYSTYETVKLVGEEDGAAPPRNQAGALNKWSDRTGWMTSKGFCSWKGISCHHRPGTSNSEVRYDGNNGVTALNLTDNGVEGTVPPELFRALTDLRHLDLSENILTGSISEDLGELTDLESLYLWGNDIQGTIPTTIGECSKLRNVYLHDNLLDGPLPSEIGALTELYNLGLHENYLTGTVPDAWGNLKKIRSLYLDSNRLSGPLHPDLFDLPRLVDLRLRDNELTGEWPSNPSVVAGWADMELLYVDKNKFSGPLPLGLGLLFRLKEVHLQHNGFTGALPTNWEGLADLKEIRLEDNKIAGSIPPGWGVALGDLRVLDLAYNDMDGAVPSELGKMVELRELRLNDNGRIGGPVPPELGDAFNLETIHLHNNNLIDSLPTSIGSLNHLKSLKVHGNAISGSIPSEVCDLTEDDTLEELTADCAGDSPSVECSCCSECFEGSSAGVESGTRP